MFTVFVGNLSFKTSADSVRGLFTRYGLVHNVKIPVHPDTGRPRGYAFVQMSDIKHAENAVSALNGQEFQGRILTVSPARSRAKGNDHSKRGKTER